jgi:peptide/nickel transport system substrate-binding protein
MLCEKLPNFEDGSAIIETHTDGTKGIAATFTIQKGARWGDGVPITTKDVLFSWDVGKHPQSGVSNFELYAHDIIDITMLDDRRFTLHFDKVTCNYQSIDDFRILPDHLERTIFEKDPKTYKDRTLYNSDITNSGLYFGPYLITQAVPGVSFTLKRNPYWWGKKPEFKTISIRVIENTAALSANLLSGEVDYIAGELGLMVEQALSLEKRLKRSHPDQYHVLYKPGLVYEHIDLNLDNPKLTDLRLRQALLYGINRDAISQQLFSGHQPVATSSINPLDVTIYTDDVTQYAYNPKKAEILLDQSGWIKKDDGFRYNTQGEKLIIEQITTAGNKSRELVQQAIQSNWKAIGIDSKIENQTPRVLFGQTTRMSKFKDTTMYAWMSGPKNIPRTTLHSTMIPTEKNNYAGQNYVGYNNPNMDKILDDLETVCDPAPRAVLWKKLQKIYTDDLPALPLYYRANSYIIPNWLTGIIPTGHQYPTSFWIENWGTK